MSAKREVFVSVDLEISDPVPGDYSLLTIGAYNRHLYVRLSLLGIMKQQLELFWW
jgi:hypothetical protein